MPEDLERLVPIRDSGTRTPLFGVHAVSGSAYAYNGLVKLLPADQPVFSFEAPSFDNERLPVNRIPVLAEEYVKILLEFQPAGDFQLLGWSFGGALAFDMAVRLAEAGAPVARLVLVDSGLPYIAEFPPEKAVAARFMADMAAISGIAEDTVDPIFAAAPADSSAAGLFERIEQAGILPEELDAELLLERFATFRAHLEALYNYEPPVVYHGPTMHLMAAESPAETMLWGKVTTDLVEVVLPGDHYSIWTGESLAELARRVDGFLLP